MLVLRKLFRLDYRRTIDFLAEWQELLDLMNPMTGDIWPEQALTRALRQRRPRPGLVHHSDRGVQDAAGPSRALLARHRLRASMSRRGNCYDNAPAESFIGSLKVELAHGANWTTRTAARREVFEYIEAFYNRRRRHSSLGYQSPAEFEALLSGDN